MYDWPTTSGCAHAGASASQGSKLKLESQLAFLGPHDGDAFSCAHDVWLGSWQLVPLHRGP